ncbi:thioredoxin-like protein [Dunaliella salina]|uniref:Thioredoxin-like protein n=1 Tax=Dunaliella salina TaxID=3046 RepID=A0ABQ7FSK2_DUNSA|nr:thioredoxin-like protein [Dunaliella salina]|eukprot:KAF5829551.1 thioredoxin-like protein [Dunaliella salina]
MAKPLILPPNLTQPTPLTMVDLSRPQPPVKADPSPSFIAPHMMGIRTDEEFDTFMQDSKSSNKTAVVEFGSTWCQKCHEIFPTFYALSKKHDQLRYAVAQVDYMKERACGVRFSPTFAFFNAAGRKVDEVTGKDPQRLADHLWLHSD